MARQQKIGFPPFKFVIDTCQVLRDQLQTIADISLFPWRGVFDQGERVFEAVFLSLWALFVVALVFLALYHILYRSERSKKHGRKSA